VQHAVVVVIIIIIIIINLILIITNQMHFLSANQQLQSSETLNKQIRQRC